MRPLSFVNGSAAVLGYTMAGLLVGHIIQIHFIAWRNRRLLLGEKARIW